MTTFLKSWLQWYHKPIHQWEKQHSKIENTFNILCWRHFVLMSWQYEITNVKFLVLNPYYSWVIWYIYIAFIFVSVSCTFYPQLLQVICLIVCDGDITILFFIQDRTCIRLTAFHKNSLYLKSSTCYQRKDTQALRNIFDHNASSVICTT